VLHQTQRMEKSNNMDEALKAKLDEARQRMRLESTRIANTMIGQRGSGPEENSGQNSLSNRLTQGECIPVSSAIRQRGMLPNTSRIALGVVLTFCSSSTSPASSNTQYQLDRSPRSKPIVSFCREKFFVAFTGISSTLVQSGHGSRNCR
jgi:hypothetical protein